MGVTKLWDILSPAGRNVTLESLAWKKLAIDTSIWLMSFESHREDPDSNSNGEFLQNAQLRGLFKRICKMLHFHVKPVFVFDGPAPAIKKKTVESRWRARQHLSDRSIKRAASKILQQQLQNSQQDSSNDNQDDPSSNTQPTDDVQSPNVDTPFGGGFLPDSDEENNSQHTKNSINNNNFTNNNNNDSKKDGLPSPVTDLYDFELSDTENNSEGVDVDENLNAALISQGIDVESFLSLPADVQREVIQQVKREQRQHFTNAKKMQLITSNETPTKFSNLQLNNLLNNSQLTKRLKSLNKSIQEGQGQRIASEPGTHYTLIKTPSGSSPNPPSAPQLDASPLSQSLQRSSSGFDKKPSPSPSPVTPLTPPINQRTKEVITIEDSPPRGGFVEEEEDEVPLINKKRAASDPLKRNLLSEFSPEKKTKVESPPTEAALNIQINLSQKRDVSDNPFLSNNLFGSLFQSPSKSVTPAPQLPKADLTTIIHNNNNNNKASKPAVVDITNVEVDVDVLLEIKATPEPEPAPAPKKVITIPHEDDEVTITGEKVAIAAHSVPNPEPILFEELKRQMEIEGLRLASKQKQVQQTTMQYQHTVSEQVISDCQELLQLFGLPYVLSPGEAEAQCAELFILHLVDGIITDDSDVFLFGGDNVYRNIFNKDKYAECYHMKDIQSEVGLNRIKLLALALMLGCDYCDGVKGIGPVTSMEILAVFGDDVMTVFPEFMNNILNDEDADKKIIEKLKETRGDEKAIDMALFEKLKKLRSKVVLDADFPNLEVLEAFQHPLVDHSTEKFEWSLPDLQGIREFTNRKFGWTQQQADELLLPIMKKLNEKQESQGTLDNFVFGNKKVESKLTSKRATKVLDKLKDKKKE